MVLGRRLRLLVIGFGCSALMLSLLLLNCMASVQTPVISRLSVGFPYRLTDCPLVLHSITGYEGAYVEDGTDREVCDVAALLVENVGQQMLSDTHIAIYSNNQCFMFYADKLPAGKKTVVLEKEGKVYSGEDMISCWASTGEKAYGDLTDQLIRVRPVDMDTLELTNLSENTIHDIYVFHKTWSEEVDAYLGGIAYKTYVGSLKPGQMLLIRPEHYADGKSKVVYIANAGLSQ